MTCTSALLAIQNSLDQTPTQAERLTLARHLETCEACRQEYDAQRRLAQLTGRWIHRTLEVSDPGEKFTARVLSRLDTRPASPSFVQTWLPLVSVLALLLFALVWVPTPAVHLPLPTLLGLSGWLQTNLAALSNDALLVFRVPNASWLPAWATILLCGIALVNAGFCVHARQRSLS